MSSVRHCILYGLILSATLWKLTLCNPHVRPHSIQSSPQLPGKATQIPGHRETWKRLLADYLAKDQLQPSDSNSKATKDKGTGTKRQGGKRQLNALDVIELLKKQNLIRVKASNIKTSRSTPNNGNTISKASGTTLPPATNFDPTRLENRLFDNPMVAQFESVTDMPRAAVPEASPQVSISAGPGSPSQDQAAIFDGPVTGHHVPMSMSFKWAEKKQLNANLPHQEDMSMTQALMGHSQHHQPQVDPQQQTKQHQHQQVQNTQAVLPDSWQQQQPVFQSQGGIPQNSQFHQQHRIIKPLENLHQSSHHSRHMQWLRKTNAQHGEHHQTKAEQQITQQEQGHQPGQLQQHHGQHRQREQHQQHAQHQQQEQHQQHAQHQQQEQQQHGQHQQQEHQQHGQQQQHGQHQQQEQQQHAQHQQQEQHQQHGQHQQQEHQQHGQQQQHGQHQQSQQQQNQQGKQHQHQVHQQHQINLEPNLDAVNLHNQQHQNQMHAPPQQSHTLAETGHQNQASNPTQAVKRGKIKLHAEINNALIGNAMAQSMRNHAPAGGVQRMFQFTSGGQFPPPQQHFSRLQVTNAPSRSIAQQSISSRVIQNVPNQIQHTSSTFDFVNTVPPVQNTGKNSHVNPTKPAVNLQSPRPLPSPSLLEFVAQPVIGQPINNQPNGNSQTMGNVANIQALPPSGVHNNERMSSIGQVQSSPQKNSKLEQGFHQQPQSPGQSTMDAHLSMIQHGASGQTGQTGELVLVHSAADQSSISANHHLTDGQTPPTLPTTGQTTSPSILSPVYMTPQVTSSPVTTVKTNTQDLSILQKLVSASNANTKNQEPIAYQSPLSAQIYQNNGQSATSGNGLLEPIQISGSTTNSNGQNSFMHPVTGTIEPVFASPLNVQSNSWTGNIQHQGSRTQNVISQIRATGELVPVFATEPNTNNQNQQSNMASGSSVSNQWHEMRSQWSSNGPQGFNTAALPATRLGHTTVQTTGTSTSNQDPAQSIFDAMFNKNNHKTSIEFNSASTGGQINNIPSAIPQDLGPISANAVGSSTANHIGSISAQVSATSLHNGNSPSQTMLDTRSHDPLLLGGHSISVEHPGHSSSVNQQNINIGHSSTMEATFQTPQQPSGRSISAYLKDQGGQQQNSVHPSRLDTITNPHITGQPTVPNSQNNGHVTFNQNSQNNVVIETTRTVKAGNQHFQPAVVAIEMTGGPVAHGHGGQETMSMNGIGNPGPQTSSNQLTIDNQRLHVANSQDHLGMNMHTANSGQPVHQTQTNAIRNSLPSTNAMTFVNVHEQHSSNHQVHNQQSANSKATNGLGLNIQQQNRGQQNNNQNLDIQQLDNHQMLVNQLNNNVLTGNSQLNNNLQTGNSQLNNNLQTGNIQLNNNLQTGNSQLNNNLQTGTSQLNNNLQTGNSQLNSNLQTGTSQLNNNLQTGNSPLINNLQTGNIQLNNNLQTGTSQLNNNLQTGNSQLNNNLQTGTSQLNNNLQNVNNRLNSLPTMNSQQVDSQHLNILQTLNDPLINNNHFNSQQNSHQTVPHTVNGQLNSNPPVLQSVNSQSHSNPHIQQTVNGQSNSNPYVQQSVNRQSQNNAHMISQQIANNEHQQLMRNQQSNSPHILNTDSGRHQVGANANTKSGVLSTLQQQGQQQLVHPSQSAPIKEAQTSVTYVNIAGSNNEPNNSSLDKASLHAKVKIMLDAGLSADEILHLFRVKTPNSASSRL